MNCPDWLRMETGSSAVTADRLTRKRAGANNAGHRRAAHRFGIGMRDFTLRRIVINSGRHAGGHSPALVVLAGLLSGFAAGLLSPPAAGLAALLSPPLAVGTSFLAASLYFSLR